MFKRLFSYGWLFFAEIEYFKALILYTYESLYLIILTIYSNNKPQVWISIVKNEFRERKIIICLSSAILFCLPSEYKYAAMSICLLCIVFLDHTDLVTIHTQVSQCKRLKRMKTTNEDRYVTMHYVMIKQVFGEINSVQRRFKYCCICNCSILVIRQKAKWLSNEIQACCAMVKYMNVG